MRLTAEAGEIYKFDEMKKCMIFMLVVSLCAVVLFGCRFLGITTLGIRQHYDDLSKEEQSLVVWTQPEEFMGDVANDGRIYAITGEQLREMIEDATNAMKPHGSPIISKRSVRKDTAWEMLRYFTGPMRRAVCSKNFS